MTNQWHQCDNSQGISDQLTLYGTFNTNKLYCDYNSLNYVDNFRLIRTVTPTQTLDCIHTKSHEHSFVYKVKACYMMNARSLLIILRQLN